MRRLKTRLRDQRREEAQPVVVLIEYDGLSMTAEQAEKAAWRSGHIPANASLLVVPRKLTHDEWDRWYPQMMAEQAAREAALQRKQADQANPHAKPESEGLPR
jgi:hypothetical protein